MLFKSGVDNKRKKVYNYSILRLLISLPFAALRSCLEFPKHDINILIIIQIVIIRRNRQSDRWFHKKDPRNSAGLFYELHRQRFISHRPFPKKQTPFH